MPKKLLFNNVVDNGGGGDVRWEEIEHSRGVFLKEDVLFTSVPHINSDVGVYRVNSTGSAATTVTYIYSEGGSDSTVQVPVIKDIIYIAFQINTNGRVVIRSYSLSGSLIGTATLGSSITNYFAVSGLKYVNTVEKLIFSGNEFPQNYKIRKCLK